MRQTHKKQTSRALRLFGNWVKFWVWYFCKKAESFSIWESAPPLIASLPKGWTMGGLNLHRNRNLYYCPKKYLQTWMYAHTHTTQTLPRLLANNYSSVNMFWSKILKEELVGETMRKEFLTFLYLSNTLLEFEHGGWNIINVSGQWSYSEYKSVIEGGRTERKTRHLQQHSLLPLEKHILLMPLLIPLNMIQLTKERLVVQWPLTRIPYSPCCFPIAWAQFSIAMEESVSSGNKS